MLGCNELSEAACNASSERITSIKAQRRVLSHLKDTDRLSKKKFTTLNKILRDEELIESRMFKRKCTHENN